VNKTKTNKFIIPVLVFLCVIVFLFLAYLDKISKNFSSVLKNQCFSIEEKIVRGDSMSGVIESGQTVKIFSGYYGCNEAKRGDVVIYSYSDDKNPLIKIIKGIPGDKFGFQKTELGQYILLNGEVLKNAQNKSYILNEKSYNMLSMYERDYSGTIPSDSYLIMGNLTEGSADSTYFGLVGLKDLLARVDL